MSERDQLEVEFVSESTPGTMTYLEELALTQLAEDSETLKACEYLSQKQCDKEELEMTC